MKKPLFLKHISFVFAIFSVALLTACNNAVESQDNKKTVSPEHKHAHPVANAGTDQVVTLDREVTLDGSASITSNSAGLLSYRWLITQKPENSNISAIGNANLVNPSFIPDTIGIYVFSLSVSDGKIESETDDDVTVTVGEGNVPPVADAGTDQPVIVNKPVSLDGSASSDGNEDTISYLWRIESLPEGSNISLSDTGSVSPVFVPDVPGIYVFSLVVNDGVTDSTKSDIVSILAARDNVRPVALAGPPQNVSTLTQVNLDGSDSFDVNGDKITYLWALRSRPPGADTVLLSDNTAVTPTFTPAIDGAYIFSLVVSDGSLSSEASTVTITASKANSAPIANAGKPQSRIVNDVVTLDGSTSSDADQDPLSYAWTIKSVPTGSATNNPQAITNASRLTALTNPNTAKPTFTPDVDGTYVFSLIVYDSKVYSTNTADVSITVSPNPPPMADAGIDQVVVIGNVVTLDGSASNDANGDSLTYLWSIVSVATSSLVDVSSLSSLTSRSITFTPDVGGDYVFALQVNDGSQASIASNITITAKPPNRAPIADAGPDQTVETGSVLILNGKNSNDPDSDPITYRWTIDSAPVGSTNSLINPLTATPAFTTDVDGEYRFSLVVKDLSLNSKSNQVIVTAAPINRPPIAIIAPVATVNTAETVILNGSASNDPDNNPITYLWSVTAPPGSAIVSVSDPVLVNPTFIPDVAGDYTISLVINDGSVNSTISSIIVTVKKANIAPIAVAGPNQTVSANSSVVTLDGSSSSDPDRDPISYNWALSRSTVGTVPTLSGATTAMPTFTPIAYLAEIYKLTLIVNDGSLNSAASIVWITTTDPNQAPIADAGLSQTVNSGATVNLNGNGSSDPENDPISYLWKFDAGPAPITLLNSTASLASFVPALNVTGIYTLSLTVFDGKLYSRASTIKITVNANGIPIANAGPDQQVSPGVLVTLDGRGSKDPDGNAITYTWTATSKPATAAAVVLSSTFIAAPTFTPNVAGDYTFSLQVNDGTISSTPDVVNISVVLPNKPPIADAGLTQTVALGDLVTLDGSRSSDPDPNDILTYSWSVLSQPTGSNITTLAAPLSKNPTFTPDMIGNYDFSLVVYDGTAYSITSSAVSIFVGLAVQGSLATPLSLAYNSPALPHSGSVNTTNSYYVVTGLSGGTTYKISMTGLTDDADLYVYNNSAFNNTATATSLLLCNSKNGGTSNDICAATLANSTDTVLYINVSGSFTTAGTAFTLNIVPSIAEGSINTPLALTAGTSTPHLGTVGSSVSSYYSIDGLDGTGSYLVSLSGVTNDVDLYVYADTNYSDLRCVSRNSGVKNDSCVASISGQALYVKVLDFSKIGGNFTLDIGTPASEGTLTMPVQLTLGTPLTPLVYSGFVDTSDSYYAIDLGTNGQGPYQVSISGLGDDADIHVYSDTSFSTSAELCHSRFVSTIDDACVPWVTGTYIYARVEGVNTVAGTTYSLSASKMPAPVAQGSAIAPIAIGFSIPPIPYIGSASQTSGVSSYYQITGLVASTNYGFLVAGLTEDVDLVVYSDSSMSITLCSSANPNNESDSCAAVVTSTSAFIKVTPYISSTSTSTYNGTYFSLLVE